APDRTYAGKGWVSWGDWLGTGTIANRYIRIGFRPFKEARKFVHGLGLKNQDEWRDYSKSDKKPADIHADPNEAYANAGWVSWGDWLGTGNIAYRYMQYRPFKEARAFEHRLGLKSRPEWRSYCKSGKKPDDIPAKPDNTYRDKGWAGYTDW